MALSEQVPGSRELLVHCGSLSKVLSPGLQLGCLVSQGCFAYPQTSYRGTAANGSGRFLVVNGHQYLLSILKSPFFIALGYLMWQFEMETVKHLQGGRPHKRTYTN